MRAATLTSYIEVARFAGLDPYEMLREAGISPDLLEDPENRYAARAIVGLLEDSARTSGQESFGLMMAECRTFASLGPLSLLLEHLPTVRDVIGALIDYRLHMNELLNFALEDHPGETVIRLEMLPEFASPQIVELSVAMAYIVLRGASGRRWQATAIHLIREAPVDQSVARRLFGAPVTYGSSFNGIATSSEALATPCPQAEETMASHARRLLDLVPLPLEHSPMTDRARRAITLLLPTGYATLDNVAHNLGLAPRALQRGLDKEQRSFAVLLNEVKRELAQRYLTDFDRPVSDIAELTGYSSLSAFGRWFAAEFGLSANAWRHARFGVPGPHLLDRAASPDEGRRH